jgi:hypothetical protein
MPFRHYSFKANKGVEFMNLDRRNFIKSAGMAAGAAMAGCTTAPKASSPIPPNGDIRSVLLHLGHNMWCDWYPEDFDVSKVKHGLPDKKLRCDDGIWRASVDYMAAKGMNQLVIDVGEGLVYPSHPELAIEGSWSPDKLANEIARAQSLGLEVIPKLNFSTTHNGWLKYYRRMVSTPQYYRLCEDLLADVSKIFGCPRYIHIGCDEEDTTWHMMHSKTRLYIVARRTEMWKYDFLHLVNNIESLGSRAWAWSDYGWDHPDFTEWCPKSVLLSNWYYDEGNGGFDPANNKIEEDKKRLSQYAQLEAAGYDQVPCGTNWVGWMRKRMNAGADDVIGSLVKYCRKTISSKHLKGFMMAPWKPSSNADDLAFIKRGIDLFAAAL